MRIIVPALLLLVLTACGGGGGDSSSSAQNYIDYPPLWNDYVVGFGETINLAEGVEIEFLSVEEDSRCPTGAQCVSEGNARIRVRTITPRGSQIVELNTNPALPSSALFDYYGVSLRKLEPFPTLGPQSTPVVIPNQAYEATLFVIKAANPP